MTHNHPLDPGGDPVAKHHHIPVGPLYPPPFIPRLWSGKMSKEVFEQCARAYGWPTAWINAEINAYNWSCDFHQRTYGKPMNKETSNAR